MSATVLSEPARQAALASSVTALRRLANYVLPPALDRRVLELGERKDELSADERAELMAWVAFTQQRSVEKLEAEAALHRLASVFPELANPA